MRKQDETGLDDLILSSKQAAKLIQISRTTLYQREGEGWFQRAGQDQWNAVAVVHGNNAYLEDRAKRATQTGTLSRVQEARARALERKNLVAEGRLMDVDEVLADTTELIAPLMDVLESIPAQCTRDLALRAVIKEKIDAARTWAADRAAAMGAKYHAMAKAEKG
jgi:hypothetical protein